MKVLWCLDREATLERSEAVITAMCNRGHEVHVWLDAFTDGPAVARAEAVGAQVRPTPRPAGDHWRAVMRRVWSARDYVRTLDRQWASAPAERHAAKSAAPSGFSTMVEATPLRYGPMRRGVDALLRVVEQSPPVSSSLAALGQLAPDVVVVSPALRWGYPQGDYLFAAATQGIRSAVITDGAADVRYGPLLRPRPSRLLVWNDDEAGAARERDAALSNRAAATGAVSMAHWQQPVAPPRRTEVRRHIGLGDADAYVLYVASDLGKLSVKEPSVAQELAGALTSAFGPDRVKLIVRPHPQLSAVWHEPTSHSTADLGALVAEASAVVGVRSRLLAEAAIAGRPVVVLDLPDLRGGINAGRLDPLLSELPRAESIADAARQIHDATEGPLRGSVPTRAWRPVGDPVDAVIEALERLANEAAPERMRPRSAVMARPLVWAPVAVRRAGETRRRWGKESKRAVRKLKDRTSRQVRRRLRAISERRLAMRAFVLGSGEDLEVLELEAARVARETITEIARSGGPIIVGPWLSEAGFELLYWIPFVRWAKTYGNIREDRLIVLSRGGAQAWYSDVSSRYVDLLSLYGVEEFRQKNEARIETQGGQKQRGRADFEREIFERASHAAGVKNAQWLHPSLMYNLFNLFWMQRAPASLVQQFTVHRTLPVPDIELPPELPPKFVAAKFYTNASFPHSVDNQKFVNHVLRQLTAQHDVVLLNTGIAFDDHDEFTPAESARLHQVSHRLTPEDNLRLQTKIVGAADAYVGTYGGFSYLAPLCGVNALTFFSEPSAFRHDHLDVARRVFEEVGGGRFIAVRTGELEFLESVLGAPPAARVSAAAS